MTFEVSARTKTYIVKELIRRSAFWTGRDRNVATLPDSLTLRRMVRAWGRSFCARRTKRGFDVFWRRILMQTLLLVEALRRSVGAELLPLSSEKVSTTNCPKEFLFLGTVPWLVWMFLAFNTRSDTKGTGSLIVTLRVLQ